MNFKSAILLPLSLMALSITSHAFDNNTKEALNSVERQFSINKNLLVAISKVESNHNQYAIGTMPNEQEQSEKLLIYLRSMNINHKSNGKKNIAIFPNDETEAKLAFLFIDRMNINYDLGLLQINKFNVEKRELDAFKLLEDIYYNISIGATILRECAAYNSRDALSSIECYNKGTNRSRYNNSYAQKVIKQYYKIYAMDGVR